MSTINGINTKGVPWGTKWANICWVWFSHPNTINVIQRGNDKDKVITICLDLVNTYGSNPKKLLNTINLNKLTNNIEVPTWEGVRSALNSLWRVWIIFLHRRDHREGEAQYKYGINIKPNKVDIQFIERLKILDEGSKIENRFAIIFKISEKYAEIVK